MIKAHCEPIESLHERTKSEIRITEIRKKPEAGACLYARSDFGFLSALGFRDSDLRTLGLSSLKPETPNPKSSNIMNTTSEERMAANRANAQKSTGPKTPEGKTASKMNAFKHGLLSREVLVSGKDEDQLTALHEWFREDLNPVGPREEMLVDQVVTTHWRLRRVLAVEAGEMEREAELQRAPAKSDAPEPALQASAEGCRLLQSWLGDVLLAVEQEGELTIGTVGRFVVHTGDRSGSLKQNLIALLMRQRTDRYGDGADEAARRERRKQEAVSFLQENMRSLAAREAECQKKEETEAKVPRAMVLLPSAEALDRIIRYESMLNRQLHRAMKELRTLQKERREVAKLPKEAMEESENEKPRMEHGLNTDKKLPNEAKALGATVQSSEFEVQSSEELRNEANLAPEERKLPNEPIARSAVQGSEFNVQSSSELPIEPAV